MGPQSSTNVCFIIPSQSPAADVRLVYHVVGSFTQHLLLVLINRPRRDGMLSLQWYTVAVAEI